LLKDLAFAFGLSAEIEHQLISQRTKEALSRKKSEGRQLGRPKGRLSKKTKLTGKEDAIINLLNKKIPVSAIARLLDVHRLTVNSFIKSRGSNIDWYIVSLSPLTLIITVSSSGLFPICTDSHGTGKHVWMKI
jgi:DNA-binding CsgD family transcriptional regulator